MVLRAISRLGSARIPWGVLSALFLGALALGAAASAQRGVPRDRFVVFAGYVLEPSGAPAVGAQVVGSAGGGTVVGPAGRFLLGARVPLEAERVELEAFDARGRSRGAHASVSTLAPGGLLDAGVLVLDEDDCLRRWVPTFGGQPGADDTVQAMTVFDDGTGPALYAAGRFDTVGGVAAYRVAKWGAFGWEGLASGLGGDFADIRSIATFDDGTGPALYVGGFLQNAGGVPVSNIAKWDGVSWTALGSGTNERVLALAAFDDGNGPALYAGGAFGLAGGLPARRIAKWDGTSWSPVAQGFNDEVWALTVFDDGGGPALYAGGVFSGASGVAASGVAKWDGTSWSRLGDGIATGSSQGLAIALTAFDDGTGPALYAGGSFTSAGGASAHYIAKWDGTSWSGLGSGMNDPVWALSAFDDGNGPSLYAGGTFTSAGGVSANRIARWDGSSWTPIRSGVQHTSPDQAVVRSLTVLEIRGVSALYVGGRFDKAAGQEIRSIAKSDGSGFAPLTRGGIGSNIAALETFDDGTGPALYAGGSATSTGGVLEDGIAKWDGSGWTGLGSGVSNSNVTAMTVHDDGTGPALFAAGGFSMAGGSPARRIAKWNGSSWSGLGSGLDNPVRALSSFDEGTGPELYAAGDLSEAGGVPVNRIARWDGTSWAPVGNGLSTSVFGLAALDDGTGMALYAGGGTFSVVGGSTCVARWNGANWDRFGGGVTGTAFAIDVFDEGDGPALFAAGNLALPSGENAVVARWDGTSWESLGAREPGRFGYSLTVFDDGRGPALYAGGTFTLLDGLALNRIARWDGKGWEALGRGLSDGPIALAGFDDGRGPALYAGGNFGSALDSHDSQLAKWGCFPDTTAPELRCPKFVLAPENERGGLQPGELVVFTVTARDDLDPAPSVVCVPPSGSFFPHGTTLVQCTATDASGNRSRCEFPVFVEDKAHSR